VTSGGRQRRRLTATVTDLEVRRQRAYLVGVARPGDDRRAARRSLDELARLTDTAGSDPVFDELLTRAEPDAATFIGAGQAARAAEAATALDIDVVVFDPELTPAQQRNLQSMFECDVVDRQAVILDIFAQHASSKEGMLQVELALLQYHLPRLRGRGTELSRQAGGIGTRGPGETKLETDRRRILDRISKLKRELAGLAATRSVQRKARVLSALPLVSLVGYTNTGKSTLLNRITDSAVHTEDRLFSTVDSTVRRAALPGGEPVLLSDTVGFIRDLPHQLVEAFQSTLEEVKQADLLLHVVDASDPSAEDQIEAVRTVLAEIDAASIEELLVFNKADAADPAAVRRLATVHEGVVISALDGAGVDRLLTAIESRLSIRSSILQLSIPYERGDVLAALHRKAAVLELNHEPAGVRARARLRPDRIREFLPFLDASD
jgi:GTP-binding protein HflX